MFSDVAGFHYMIRSAQFILLFLHIHALNNNLEYLNLIHHVAVSHCHTLAVQGDSR